MPYDRPLAQRERALEEVFYQKESKRLVEAMQAKKTREGQFSALSRTIGVDDPEIVNPLLDLGLRESNVTALVMAPLVCVAWADHKVDGQERGLIDRSAAALGIEVESDGEKLLELWLNHQPHENLIDAWAAYVHELRKALGEKASHRLRDDIVARANKIARSLTKSLLRGGGPTESELEIIRKIETAFSASISEEDAGESNPIDSSMPPSR